MDNDDAPVTKRELKEALEEMEIRLAAQMREQEARLAAQMREQDARLAGQMRDMQTELLKAFPPWQDSVRIQFRELEANTGNSVTATKQRMEIIGKRLSEIEKKLLLNPPAA